MSTTPVAGPLIPTGYVIHPALEMFADGDDADEYADLFTAAGLTVKLTPEVKAAVWHGPEGDVSLRPVPVNGQYNAAGRLCLLRRDGTVSENEAIRLAITDDPRMEPSGWKWRAEWKDTAFPSGNFSLTQGQVLNLSTVILSGMLPAARQDLVDALRAAAADLRQVIIDNPGGGGGPADWGTLLNRPVVVAAGSSKATARAAIDAIAASDIPAPVAWATIDKPAVVAAGATQAAARAAIGAITGADVPAAPTKATLGLGSVDNTTDANKPISTATQAALNAKAKSAPSAPGTFWGMWAAGTAPTPTGTGPHWIIEIP